MRCATHGLEKAMPLSNATAATLGPAAVHFLPARCIGFVDIKLRIESERTTQGINRA